MRGFGSGVASRPRCSVGAVSSSRFLHVRSFSPRFGSFESPRGPSCICLLFIFFFSVAGLSAPSSFSLSDVCAPVTEGRIYYMARTCTPPCLSRVSPLRGAVCGVVLSSQRPTGPLYFVRDKEPRIKHTTAAHSAIDFHMQEEKHGALSLLIALSRYFTWQYFVLRWVCTGMYEEHNAMTNDPVALCTYLTFTLRHSHPPAPRLLLIYTALCLMRCPWSVPTGGNAAPPEAGPAIPLHRGQQQQLQQPRR